MPSADSVLIPYQVLNEFTREVFQRLGVPSDDARTTADVLGQADLRGVDTHGTGLLPGYVERIRSGMINPSPQMKVVKESGATMVIDADQALGQVSSYFGMQQAINKALLTGVGWVHTVNSNHHGALAYYPLMAAAQDLVGIVTTTTSPAMVPWGSREPVVGNNPLAIAVPSNDHQPPVLDMACSLYASGNIRLARERGEPIPDGLSVDALGEPNTDPGKSASILPAGGYKGSGLAMMLGFLAGTLAGCPFTGYRNGRSGAGPSELAHLMVAVDVRHMTDLEEFKESVDQTVESWKRAAPRRGFDEVLVPGEIEWRSVPDREKRGIPLNAATAEELLRIADELELEPPKGTNMPASRRPKSE